jgi:hypothetical protein
VDPTPERFRRLARSAPYRWRALRFEGTWGAWDEPYRVRVSQPDLVRVETLDGAVRFDGRHGSLGSSAVLTSDGRSVPWTPVAPVVERDEDGLVVTERTPWNDGPELPMWQDYRFVAVLDPYELSADVDVLSVVEVEHGGRPAWEAVLQPTDSYEPRCGCCPLLPQRSLDVLEGVPLRSSYPDAHRVRLDVGTGVCVAAHEVGGEHDGVGHLLVLLEVES